MGTKPWLQHWDIWQPELKVAFSSENEVLKNPEITVRSMGEIENKLSWHKWR